MPNTTNPSLLATALPILGDPYQRLMGVLISVDGKRCVSQLIQSTEGGKLLLRDPLAREHFKAWGFDLSVEAVRWVDDPPTDQEYQDAARVFTALHEVKTKEAIRRGEQIRMAPKN